MGAKFVCPSCKASLKLSEHSRADQHVECPQCRTVFLPSQTPSQVPRRGEATRPKKPSSAKGAHEHRRPGESSHGRPSWPLLFLIGGSTGLAVLTVSATIYWLLQKPAQPFGGGELGPNAPHQMEQPTAGLEVGRKLDADEKPAA